MGFAGLNHPIGLEFPVKPLRPLGGQIAVDWSVAVEVPWPTYYPDLTRNL